MNFRTKVDAGTVARTGQILFLEEFRDLEILVILLYLAGSLLVGPKPLCKTLDHLLRMSKGLNIIGVEILYFSFSSIASAIGFGYNEGDYVCKRKLVRLRWHLIRLR